MKTKEQVIEILKKWESCPFAGHSFLSAIRSDNYEKIADELCGKPNKDSNILTPEEWLKENSYGISLDWHDIEVQKVMRLYADYKTQFSGEGLREENKEINNRNVGPCGDEGEYWRDEDGSVSLR